MYVLGAREWLADFARVKGAIGGGNECSSPLGVRPCFFSKRSAVCGFAAGEQLRDRNAYVRRLENSDSRCCRSHWASQTICSRTLPFVGYRTFVDATLLRLKGSVHASFERARQGRRAAPVHRPEGARRRQPCCRVGHWCRLGVADRAPAAHRVLARGDWSGQLVADIAGAEFDAVYGLYGEILRPGNTTRTILLPTRRGLLNPRRNEGW
jgi:hypothetical protein